MVLIRLGSGSWGEVMALTVSEDRCPALDFLMDLDPSQKASVEKMMNLLISQVPGGGPRRHNRELSRPLQDKIFEFRVNRLRVLYFYDRPGRVVICTHGFSKSSRKTPQKEIRRASDLRSRYLEESRGSRIKIVDLKSGGA